MSDQPKSRRPDGRRANGEPDFATQMARAELGRHYIDTRRIEQTLRDGEIVFRHKAHGRRASKPPGPGG